MRIVRQANEVTSQFLGPAQQGLRVLVSVSAAGAIRRFGMNRDAAQKDRSSIQQYLRASRLYGAETYQVFDSILTRTYVDFIEFGRLRGPALQPWRGETNHRLPSVA